MLIVRLFYDVKPTAKTIMYSMRYGKNTMNDEKVDAAGENIAYKNDRLAQID
jgi:hypothetical protein